eukprot:655531-Pelagomonas_calceolata.AAC.25
MLEGMGVVLDNLVDYMQGIEGRWCGDLTGAMRSRTCPDVKVNLRTALSAQGLLRNAKGSLQVHTQQCRHACTRRGLLQEGSDHG